MTKNTINNLVDTRRRVVKAANRGEMQVKKGAELLGITRQGLWKIRKRVKKYGYTERALLGRKRGPKAYHRARNRTSKEVEDLVCDLYDQYMVGPDRLNWLLEDRGIDIHRSAVYRILVRRKRIKPKEKEERHDKLYAKGYQGCEVQIDTAEPFGKGKPILISAINDHSRWGYADLYHGNTSANAARALRDLVSKVPFKVRRVRTDNRT